MSANMLWEIKLKSNKIVIKFYKTQMKIVVGLKSLFTMIIIILLATKNRFSPLLFLIILHNLTSLAIT
jgi:hypothetical protein